MRKRLVSAVWIALFSGAGGAWAEERGGASYLCRSSSAPIRSWTFSVDYDNRTVAIEAPVNWTWFTRQHGLFLHGVFVNGRHYLTQSYTLDRTTGAFEVCDFASAGEQAAPCDSSYLCRPTDIVAPILAGPPGP